MADPLEAYSIFPTLSSYVFILVTINLTEFNSVAIWTFVISNLVIPQETGQEIRWFIRWYYVSTGKCTIKLYISTVR